MLYRITMTHTKHVESKTAIAVELLEQNGPITKIVERMQFDVDGCFDGPGTPGLYRAAGLILKEAGYDVIVPEAEAV